MVPNARMVPNTSRTCLASSIDPDDTAYPHEKVSAVYAVSTSSAIRYAEHSDDMSYTRVSLRSRAESGMRRRVTALWLHLEQSTSTRSHALVALASRAAHPASIRVVL